MNELNYCPICNSRNLLDFVSRKQVPVHQNLPYDEQISAKNVTRGDMLFAVCEECGFVFNRVFELEKLEYGEKYENSNLHSNVFSQHVNTILTNIIEINKIKKSKIVEVGCGNGQFLIQLIDQSDKSNTGIGFDPSYDGKLSVLENRVSFLKKYFSSELIDFVPDIVLSRHVIEHIPEPIPFIQKIKKIMNKNSKIFIETPTIDWILKNNVFWDFTYEHCSFFSLNSLASAFQIAGLKVEKEKTIFGGQYIWMEGKIQDKSRISISGEEIIKLVKKYSSNEKYVINSWSDKILNFKKDGKIALWGAGGKGTTFANFLDPKNLLIDSIIDNNPKKWDKFIPGSGHKIINPQKIEEHGIKTIIVMNPNYNEEISKTINRNEINIVNT